MNRRVAITGLGGVFPGGLSVAEFKTQIFADQSLIREWPEAVALGKQLRSKVSAYTSIEETGLQTIYADHLQNYPETYRDLLDRLPPEHLATADLGSIWAMLAAQQAVAQAGWESGDIQNERTGVIIGSGGGGHAVLRQCWENFFQGGKKSRQMTSHNIDRTMVYRDAANVCCLLKTRGVCEGLGSACACGLGNIGYAYRLIRHGYQDRCLAGSTEGTSIETFMGFDAMQVLSRNLSPTASSRSFAADRAGFVCSFGCGLVALETLETAQARGAPILAVIDGYHNNSDGNGNMFVPSNTGQRRLLSGLREDCATGPAADQEFRVDVVKAHGTSTPVGDIVELMSIADFFGQEGYRIAAPKSQIGHMLGAAGSVELILSVLMLQEQQVSPCLNSEHLSETLEPAQLAEGWTGLKLPPAELRPLLSTTTLSQEIRSVVALNFGFGGTNASIKISKDHGD